MGLFVLFLLPIWVFLFTILWFGSHNGHPTSDLYAIGALVTLVANALMMLNKRISKLEKKLGITFGLRDL